MWRLHPSDQRRPLKVLLFLYTYKLKDLAVKNSVCAYVISVKVYLNLKYCSSNYLDHGDANWQKPSMQWEKRYDVCEEQDIHKTAAIKITD